MTTSDFQETITQLWDEYRPSRHPFFGHLRKAPVEVVRSRFFLEELYKRYQAAMHASRAMAYRMPHLDRIDLRMVKFSVLADDDGAPDGDSHHYQLRRTWTALLGQPPAMLDDEFDDLERLKAVLDPATAQWVDLCEELYPRGLGPWLMVEGLAHEWIGLLLQGLSPCFPDLGNSDYFRENFATCVEVRHAQEALETTLKVMARKPHLAAETLAGARRIGEGLNGLWRGMEELITGEPPSRGWAPSAFTP